MGYRFSIRVKIILALLIPLASVLLILTVIGSDMINTGVQNVAREQEASLAYMISEQLTANLNRYPSLLKNAIPETGSDSPDRNLIREQLDSLQESGLDLVFDQGVGIYTGSGLISAHTEYPNTGTWENIETGDADTIIAERKAMFSLLRQNARPPYISLFVPVFSKSGGSMIMEGRISPEFSLFGSMLVHTLEIRNGTAGYAILIDRRGNILYQRFRGDLYEGKDAALAEFFSRTGVAQGNTVILTNNQTGHEQYAGYSPVAGTQWGIIAHEDRQVILHTLDNYLNLTRIMIIGAMIVTILIIILLIDQILRPISILVSKIRETREGTLEPIAISSYQDETGILAEEFNKMVVSLKASFQDLQTAKKRYQSILDQAYDGILILDAVTYHILENNQMARIITGYTSDQLFMKPFPSLLSPSYQAGFTGTTGSLTEEGMRTEWIGEILCSDGIRRYAEINLVRIDIEDHEYIQATIRDITMRIEAEEKIRSGIQMLARNQETLAILNDQIRNPLSIISILNDSDIPGKSEKIQDEIERIDDIITKLDNGWLKSDKVRRIMIKHYEIEENNL